MAVVYDWGVPLLTLNKTETKRLWLIYKQSTE
jgi:hypothetical protein